MNNTKRDHRLENNPKGLPLALSRDMVVKNIRRNSLNS
jgi:hypothetical protein